MDFVKFMERVSIPDGRNTPSTTSIDISAHTDGRTPNGCVAKLANYQLPYVAANGDITAVQTISSTDLVVYNTGTAWSGDFIIVTLLF